MRNTSPQFYLFILKEQKQERTKAGNEIVVSAFTVCYVNIHMRERERESYAGLYA